MEVNICGMSSSDLLGAPEGEKERRLKTAYGSYLTVIYTHAVKVSRWKAEKLNSPKKEMQKQTEPPFLHICWFLTNRFPI